MILRNFISSPVAVIYCLYGKLVAVWNLTSVKLTEMNFAPSEFHFARSHVNADNEVTLNQSEILPGSEISNLFEFISGLL